MRIIFLFSLIALTVSGCRLWDPTFMPAGYKYHHEEYKSPPGPEAPDIGYEYSESENERHIDMWRYAVKDLLMQTRAQGLSLPQDVQLVTDLAPNAFSNTYDYMLRENLRNLGHTLYTEEGAATVFYSAYEADRRTEPISTVRPSYNSDDVINHDDTFREFGPNHKDMELVIGIIEGGILVKEARGIYDLPMTGFVPGAYVPGHANPLKQQGRPGCTLLRCD